MSNDISEADNGKQPAEVINDHTSGTDGGFPNLAPHAQQPLSADVSFAEGFSNNTQVDDQVPQGREVPRQLVTVQSQDATIAEASNLGPAQTTRPQIAPDDVNDARNVFNHVQGRAERTSQHPKSVPDCSWYDPAGVTGFIPDEVVEVDEILLQYNRDSDNLQPSKPLPIDPEHWVPEEFYRQPTGATVAEPESVLGTSGRTYHGFKQGKYFLPNDGQEQDRLDFQHRALTVLIGEKLHRAPLKSPKYVMDIATGTGIWAVEFANQYPDSKVVGVDLSKIQPSNAPPNVEFIKDDCEEPWIFDNKFDYVHARAVFTCFSDQKAVMRHAFDNLNPGGWIEYLDGSFVIGCLDGSIEGTALKRWGELVVRGGLALGRNLEVTKHFKQWLEETGFVDVVEKKLPWAYSPWPKDRRLKLAGQFMQTNIYENIRGISHVLLTGAGLTDPEIDKLILDVRADLMNPGVHAFMPVWSVYGRKPLDNEVKQNCT